MLQSKAPLPAGPALALLLLLTLCLPGAARADEMDLLGDLDAAMSETAAKQPEANEGKGVPAQLRDNLNLTVRLRGYHFTQSVGGDVLDKDTQNDLGEIKIDYATAATWERLRLATSGWLETGNTEDTYNGVTEAFQDRDRRRNYWEMNELYGVLDLGGADLTLGRKIVVNGLSTLASPANRYSGLDLNDPLDPRRLGVWMAALDMPVGDTTFSFTVMPWFSPPKTPGTKSRWVSGESWAGIPDYFGASESQFSEFLDILYFFSDLSGVDIVSLLERFLGINFGGAIPDVAVEYKVPDPEDPDQWGTLGQMKTSVGEYDLFASAYRGPSVYPVLKAKVDMSAPSARLIVEHPVADQLAGGVSTTWKELEMHAEALYSHSEDGRDDSYVQYVGGSTWSNQSYAAKMGMKRLDLTAEYVAEAMVSEQSADGYLVSSKYARLGRNDVVLRLDLHFTDDFSVQYMADFLLSNSGRLNRVGTTWRLSEALTWKTAYEAFDGPDTSYYGRWRNQDRVVTSLSYTF